MIRSELEHSDAGRRTTITPSQRKRVFTQTGKVDPNPPSEIWYEPGQITGGYKIVVEPPGKGYRHVVTPDDIRERLAVFPAEMLRNLEVVKMSTMTRKRLSECIYGLQWGNTVYLYPMDDDLIERFKEPLPPQAQMDAKRYGGKYGVGKNEWTVRWTEQMVRDFYLNNILIHEIGHTVDDRNTSPRKREAFANHFADVHGFPQSNAYKRRLRR